MLTVAVPLAVRLHCNACGQAADLAGRDCRRAAGVWTLAHYQPVVDEVTLTDGTTWRRKAA